MKENNQVEVHEIKPAIDLTKYGWSETTVHLLKEEDVCQIFMMNENRMRFFDMCLKAREMYRTEEANKMLKSYNIVNLANRYESPNKLGNWFSGAGEKLGEIFRSLFSFLFNPFVLIIIAAVLLFVFIK